MLKNKKILIGITGGIAVYKVCSLINKLKKLEVVTKVIMTMPATKFVTPLTFQHLTNSRVYLDAFDISEFEVEHIKLADWCDLLLIVPATYNTINKIKSGIADNLLTTVISALPRKIPVLIVPAMNTHMWENEILQENIKGLRNIKINTNTYKYNFIGPKKGHLACGYEGEGAITDNDEIINSIQKLM